MSKKRKIIVILGPTSSGKTRLGVKLAYTYNGEIVSADSRQVYKGMDIGTGKDLKDYRLKFSIFPGLAKRSGAGNFQFSNKLQKQNSKLKIKNFRIVKIPYHLIDVVSPKTQFSLARFKKMADKAIEDILKQGKTPIVVGGTGLYLQALVDNYNLSAVEPDKKLRERLEKKTVLQLFGMLKKLNSKFANKLHESDKKNKRRLIRYIEIANHRESSRELSRIKSDYSFLMIGLEYPREVLRKRICKRLIERLEKEGMVEEVERLHNKGVSWGRLEDFGLEYKYIALYLQGKLDYEEMVEKLNIVIRQFAKRQMTWFRRWTRLLSSKAGASACLAYGNARRARQGKIYQNKIHWVKNKREAEKLAKKFLK